MITIVDYGMGNLGSIQNMLKKIGVQSHVTSEPDEIDMAEKLILPGVGGFQSGMANLAKYELIETLNRNVLEKKTPILGICLGMQLMTHGSEEGSLQGLGWIASQVVRFSNTGESPLKVPHMGWNDVLAQKDSRMLTGLADEPRFYFVHSYYVRCERPEDVLLAASYGMEFTAGFEHENIIGVQFHPEKSHKFGMRLLENFAGF